MEQGRHAICITGYTDLSMWYSGHVGEVYYTIGHLDIGFYGGSVYWVRDANGYRNIVRKEDCEEIEMGESM